MAISRRWRSRGTAAIVLEILHPSVVAGVQDLSSYRDDPFRRARTTLGYVLGTTFGNTASATRLIDNVKRVHTRINGTRPDGVPYRALDPELLAWVHTCIPWMIMTAFERYRRPLTPAERDRYLAEQAIIGRMGGAARVPGERRRARRVRRGDAAEAGSQRADPRVLRVPDDRAIRADAAGGDRPARAPLRRRTPG